jgi:hypothetical protein
VVEGNKIPKGYLVCKTWMLLRRVAGTKWLICGLFVGRGEMSADWLNLRFS